MLPLVLLSCHVAAHCSESSHFRLTCRLARPSNRLDTIGFLLLLDAACQDMAGTRQPVADSGHFDRLDILRLWP
jgi:hypothetical protein